MATTEKDWPSWLERALQGLTYWTGHRRCLYRNYPLAEAAFVAELCNLIHANLPDKYSLHCEEQYSEFLHQDARPSLLTERSRADLVVYETVKTRRGERELHAKFIIEVKRAMAPKAQIDADLKRLMAVRAACPEVKTYLVVVAEAHRPTRFVSDAGASITKRQRLEDFEGYFKVRRTLKAAHAYTRIERAQYACLVEAFADA
ncbi:MULTISPECIES: hypothetical protein [unclassified Acidovorax]|uniref:hypothetical protein n=1 Tax=unclassified Acidovorax TaxID=2684926 RepID=UPI001C48728F|nr:MULTISPECIES: hypothetical protein [unclassified Acidovorax]MBV7461303.1 hypothetical protein [Acidovorax sp. sif0632]MBV7466593.1 hypothetical protein [Acidovorax sp. sif0613]